MEKDTQIIIFDFPVFAGISLRKEGSMTGYEVKRNLCERIGLKGSLVTIHLKHSKIVCTVDASNAGENGMNGDGLVTDDPETVLGVTVADCMPIYISDLRGRIFGVLHSGWKGTGILETALNIFTNKLGVPVSEISVLLGPSIRSCCYKVDRERAEFFQDQWGINAAQERNGQFFLDLLAANKNILRTAGVTKVKDADYCTSCNTIFGSYRREGPEGFTKMLAFIGTDSGVGRNATVPTKL